MNEGEVNPLVSVVIPTHERPEALQRCLASIESARRPDPIEVVVVDDGGSTPLEGVVAPFRSSLGAVLLRRTNGGPGVARNAGVSHARGSLIVFVDDDCTIDPGALVAFTRGLRNNPGALVGGRTLNRLIGNPYSTASQVIVDVVYAFNNPDPNDARFVATNNMAVERSAFLDVRGFDEHFNAAAEDREFCDRWRHLGGRIVYDADAIVNHAHDLTFSSFVRQHIRYGRGAYRYHRIRADRGSGLMRGDLRFHALLPGHLIRRVRREPASKAIQELALLVVWQLANAGGFLAAAAADGIHRFGEAGQRRHSDTSARQPGFGAELGDRVALDDALPLP